MGISRHILFGKLGISLFKTIESAAVVCKLRGNFYIELVHWLDQLHKLQDSDWQRIARHFSIWERLDCDIAAALHGLPVGATGIGDFSPQIESAIERAWTVTSLVAGENRIRSAWFMVALLETPELRRVLLSISPAFAEIPTSHLMDMLPEMIDGSPESSEPSHAGYGLPSTLSGTSSHAMAAPVSESAALTQYCTDLTARARHGDIDPVVGREHEMVAMIDVLMRRRQNNPLLTGDAGVGKTAVVESLALAIVNGQVSPCLAQAQLLSLDVGALLAGASMKGEFEVRLKRVLTEAAASTSTTPIILFVDEIHTLIGAGGQTGTGDAANLLKPALARGSLRMIGATTWSEYKRHIEKDPALTRRFQVMQVTEPGQAAATDMVRALAATLAQHHQVWIKESAIRAAVTLSHRYIPARQLPDKAISLLDTACARVALSLHTPPPRVHYLREQLEASRLEHDALLREERIGQGDNKRLPQVNARMVAQQQELDALELRWRQEAETTASIMKVREQLLLAVESEDVFRDQRLSELDALTQKLSQFQQGALLLHAQVDDAVVAAIVADWTGIPVGNLVQDDIAAVLQLPAQLAQRVIGQTHALQVISARIQTARAELADPDKPIGVFMLAGPSGVGKTETALALAAALYGGEQHLITVNMSEFQEPHTISTLKGAPPGYVGYGAGGILTEAVRRRPYSVVLLDEIEKAHPDVHEMFYQVFDKGWMEDGEGCHIDFKNTIILLTSNIGADEIAAWHEDPAQGNWTVLSNVLQAQLRKVFSAAFMGRVTSIPYLPLAASDMEKIVTLHLQKIIRRMQEQHNVTLIFSENVITRVVDQYGARDIGARRAVSFIEQHLLAQLSTIWLNALQARRNLSAIHVDFRPGNVEEEFLFQLSDAELS